METIGPSIHNCPLVAYFLLGQHKSLSVTSSPIPQIRGKVIGLFTMIHFNIAPNNLYYHISVQNLALKNCMHPVHLLIENCSFLLQGPNCSSLSRQTLQKTRAAVTNTTRYVYHFFSDVNICFAISKRPLLL